MGQKVRNRDAEEIAAGNDGRVLSFGAAFALAIIAIGIVAVGIITGCSTYKGGNFLDGTSLQIGAKIPVSDNIQITALSFVSGTMYQYEENTKMRIRTIQTNHLNVAYVYRSDTTKITEAEVEPVETNNVITVELPLKN